MILTTRSDLGYLTGWGWGGHGLRDVGGQADARPRARGAHVRRLVEAAEAADHGGDVGRRRQDRAQPEDGQADAVARGGDDRRPRRSAAGARDGGRDGARPADRNVAGDARRIAIPYAPRPLQRAFHDAFQAYHPRASVIVCHRRFGKSVMTINQLPRSAFENPLEEPRFTYAARTYKEAESIAWTYLPRYWER